MTKKPSTSQKIVDKLNLLTLEVNKLRSSIQTERFNNQKHKIKSDKMFEIVQKTHEQVNEVLNNQDSLFGMFQKHQEELEMLAHGHKVTLEISDRVKNLENLHPNNQHIQI